MIEDKVVVIMLDLATNRDELWTAATDGTNLRKIFTADSTRLALIDAQTLHRASTSVTFDSHGARVAFSLNPGLLGMPPNGSKIRRGEAPQVGVACENPSLDRKQPTSLSE